MLINILAASLTQSISQCVQPEDYLIEADLYFEILSFSCGIFIFILGIFRIIIYHRIILKLNLKGKEKFIQKAINSYKTSYKKRLQNDFFKVELNKEEGFSSFDSFSYRESKKPFINISDS